CGSSRPAAWPARRRRFTALSTIPEPNPAAVLARSAARRADGPRVAARLALVSFGVLALSIVWGVFGATRHGGPVKETEPPVRSPTVAADPATEAAP
ncbi:MAG: hypothetical protein ACKOTB_06365, partial [Planctomycetia bacterium]